MSPHSVNQRPVRSSRLALSSSPPREQTSLLREQAEGWVTLQVPSAQRASRDLTEVSTAQTKTTTKMTERISMVTERGLTQVGCLRMIFLSKVFLTSSLKLVSHFWRRTFLPTQPADFFMAFQ